MGRVRASRPKRVSRRDLERAVKEMDRESRMLRDVLAAVCAREVKEALEEVGASADLSQEGALPAFSLTVDELRQPGHALIGEHDGQVVVRWQAPPEAQDDEDEESEDDGDE